MTAAPLIEATALVKRYRARGLLRRGAETRALDDVSMQIHEGEVVALIGESGSGKTTLGKVLTRLTSLDAGQVRFAGEDLFRLGSTALRERRRDFQMVFQNQRANLHPKMTVDEMLDESLRLHRPELVRDERRAQIDELLSRVSLESRREQRPESLSGGERRRVGLARILATRPRLIVADEPTSGLDAAIKLQIIDLLKSLKNERLTYLLISHDLGLVRRIADRVLVMLRGRIIEEVPAAQIGSDRHHPYTRRLFMAAELGGASGAERRRSPAHVDDSEKNALEVITDEELLIGCVHLRECERARELGIVDRCRRDRPQAVAIGPGHWVACFAAAPPAEEVG